jgi:hypothetical protein
MSSTVDQRCRRTSLPTTPIYIVNKARESDKPGILLPTNPGVPKKILKLTFGTGCHFDVSVIWALLSSGLFNSSGFQFPSSVLSDQDLGEEKGLRLRSLSCLV